MIVFLMPVHDYFKRDSARWCILDFLNESIEEPFKLKIDTYLKSLEIIMDNEQGKRSDRAKLLHDNYKKEPKPDKSKAKNWETEHSRKQVHVHQPIITENLTGTIATGTINGGIINGLPMSKKRKSTEINESDSDATKIDESNVPNAPEDVEDVLVGNNIIDGEQAKEHNLEKSWEFKEPIPGWLKLIHKHREDLGTTTDTTDFESLSQVAETSIWWRIIDTCDPKLAEIITEREFLNLSESLLSNLPSDWDVLEPPVERCLLSIAMLDKKGLKKVAKTVMHHGVCGAINKIRKILTTSNKVEDENPFLDSPHTEITIADSIVQDDDYKHPDVCYTIELLRYTYNMIDKKIPQRGNSERDIDVIFKSHMFSCFDDIMDSHFGEMVSRASRQRRAQAIDASDKAEGYHLDWLFTKHDLAKDLTWGREFSLCERAGPKLKTEEKYLIIHSRCKKHCETCIRRY